jgi:DNA repair protein RecO (recombination protein O)
MASYKTTGIVLRRSNFGEADRIVTFLTPDRGKIRVVAKGVRRIKSRMAGHLELFNTVEIMLAEGRNLDIITSARLQRSADAIVQDYERMGHGYLFAEMVDRLVEDDHAHPELFDQLDVVYQRLGEEGINVLTELHFKLNLLDTLGYRPHLEACAVCHNHDETQTYYISPAAGGMVCANCTSLRSLPMTSNHIKLWRLALNHPVDQLAVVKDAGVLAQETMPAVDEFYDYTFGKRFKSQQFLTRA